MAAQSIPIRSGKPARKPATLDYWEAKITTAFSKVTHGWYVIGKALDEIHKKELYKKGYPTFEAYIRERWGFTRQWAYQRIEAARAIAPYANRNVQTFLHAGASKAHVLAEALPRHKRIIGDHIKKGMHIRALRELNHQLKAATIGESPSTLK